MNNTTSALAVTDHQSAVAVLMARRAVVVEQIDALLAEVDAALATGLASGVEFAADQMEEVARLSVERDALTPKAVR